MCRLLRKNGSRVATISAFSSARVPKRTVRKNRPIISQGRTEVVETEGRVYFPPRAKSGKKWPVYIG